MGGRKSGPILQEGVHATAVKHIVTKIFVRIVKKLKNLTMVSGIGAVLLSNIR